MSDLLEELEIIIFVPAFVAAVIFITRWYLPINSTFPRNSCKGARNILRILPVVSSAIMLVTLCTLAAPSVVENPFWIFYYLVIGFVWIFPAMSLTFRCFDLSWRDDVINKTQTQPAVLPVAGSVIGITLIYSGANIGDGPGWWCVIYAAGMGTVMWFILGHIIQKTTDVFSTVTIGRDKPCAIRMFAYLSASGLALAHASSGDSISFYIDIIEIAVTSLTAIPIAVLAILVEKYYIGKRRKEMLNSFRAKFTSYTHIESKSTGNFTAFLWGIVYMAAAVGAMYLNDYILAAMAVSQ